MTASTLATAVGTTVVVCAGRGGMGDARPLLAAFASSGFFGSGIFDGVATSAFEPQAPILAKGARTSRKGKVITSVTTERAPLSLDVVAEVWV